MPKLHYPIVVSLDWLCVYCFRHGDICQECKHFKVEVSSDYPTAMYKSKAVIKWREGDKIVPFAEMLFAPRVSTIPPDSLHLRILNEQLYTSEWFKRYCIVMASLPLEFRSVSRIDVCADFNKMYGGLSPRLLIKKYISGDYLKVGVNTGYMSFRNMGYVIANNARKLPQGFKRKSPDINAITWGSKGYVQTQLYNKTLELRDVKFKPWIFESWQRAGLDVNDVWRLEFRVQGAGKEMQLLDSGDLFSLGVSDISDHAKIYDMFLMYAERYFRFVKSDYHVKKTQMKPVQFFSKDIDLEKSIKLKIHPTKTSSNRTSTMVCNFLNKLNSDLEKGLIASDLYDVKYKIFQVSNEIARMFNGLRPEKKEGGDFDQIRRLEIEYIRQIGGLFKDYSG